MTHLEWIILFSSKYSPHLQDQAFPLLMSQLALRQYSSSSTHYLLLVWTILKVFGMVLICRHLLFTKRCRNVSRVGLNCILLNHKSSHSYFLFTGFSVLSLGSTTFSKKELALKHFHSTFFAWRLRPRKFHSCWFFLIESVRLSSKQYMIETTSFAIGSLGC